MSRVIIPHNRLWEFFKEYDDRLEKDWLMVAEKPEEGVEIYATKSTSGLPEFCVDVDKQTVFSVKTISRDDAECEYKSLLRVYITDEGDKESKPESESEEEDDDSKFFTDEERERLENIDVATACMVETLADCDLEATGLFSCDLADISKHICEHLYNHYGLSICYPTIDRSGNVVLYPFGEDDDI